MEVMESIRQKKRMCEYYGNDTCGTCPGFDIDCSFLTDKP